MITNYLSVFLLFTVLAGTVFTGKVVRITDGDTIVVLNGKNEQVKIRLEGGSTARKWDRILVKKQNRLLQIFALGNKSGSSKPEPTGMAGCWWMGVCRGYLREP